MTKLKNLYFKLTKESLYIAISALILALVCWYEISPFNFKDYNQICSINYGSTPQYDRCMNPYWSEYGIDKAGLITLLGVAVVAAIIFTTDHLLKKPRF